MHKFAIVGELPVSVVIPTIGRGQLLRSCLASVTDCRPRASEVVVVDQSDGDGVRAIVEGYAGRGVRRVADEGRGIGRAINTGFRHVKNDVVLVTHDDCTVAADWVRTGARLMSEQPCGIVTGRVFPVGDPRLVPSKKTDPRPRDYTGTREYAILYPLNMGCSRHAMLEFGGFDERIVPAAEDNDFCHRWLRAGRDLRYDPELVVWHDDWRMPGQMRATYQGYAYGQGMFYAKHLRAGELTMLLYVARHLKWAWRGEVAAVVRHRRAWWDPRLGITIALTRGLRDGWRLRGPVRD